MAEVHWEAAEHRRVWGPGGEKLQPEAQVCVEEAAEHLSGRPPGEIAEQLRPVLEEAGVSVDTDRLEAIADDVSEHRPLDLLGPDA